LAVAGGAVLVMYRIAHAAERRRRARWHLARNMWRHPDRGLRAQRRSMPFEVARDVFLALARNVFLALATTALIAPAHRVMARVLSPNDEETRQPSR
jgi:hypothetical protein